MKNIVSITALVNTRNLKSTCDARKMTRAEQIGLRKRAFAMLNTLNVHPMQIAACLCVAGRTVYRWMEAQALGLSSVVTTYLKPKRKSKLSLEQVQTIRHLVSCSLPTDHGFQTLLWTRKLVADLCQKMFGIQLSESSIGRTLRSLKLSYQKPIRKAYQQDPDKVARYCEEVFPTLFQKAQAEDADVYFLDETTVRSDPCNGKTWGTQGQTPAIPQDGQQHRTNVIGVLSLKGESQFLVYEQRTDADLLITFIDEFMKTKKRKVYLILDNARYHHAKKVHEHIQTHYQDRLALVYQPPYSPELNPIELVWAHLKSHGLNRVLTKSLEGLKDTVCRHLKKFTDNFSLGLSLFGKETLAYIKRAESLLSPEAA